MYRRGTPLGFVPLLRLLLFRLPFLLTCDALSCLDMRRENDNTVSLTCNRLRLREPSFKLTGGIKPENVSRIHLNDNFLTTLEEFAFSNFTNLDVLEMQNNQIETIARTAFAGVAKLTRLDLSKNRLLYIPIDALQYLDQLIELELAMNQISTIPHGAFLRNPHLEKIDLQDNALRLVDPLAFRPLLGAAVRYSPMLINLANNNLTYLDPLIENASPFSAIKFKLVENPWNCNCKIRFMYSKLRNGESNYDWPSCSSPLANQGKSWEHMSPMDFACTPSVIDLNAEQRSVSWDRWPSGDQSGNWSAISVVEVEEGEDLRLVCRGNVDPPQAAVWSRDGEPLVVPEPSGRTTVTYTWWQVVQFNETLVLHSATLNDSGTYTCNVTNQMGSSALSLALQVRQRAPKAVDAAPDTLGGETPPRRSEYNWSTSSSSTMHYVLLVSAVVAGVVLILAVVSFAYYCVKNRYLSYNAVVYRVRKQEALATKKNTKVNQTSGPSEQCNYLNFGNVLGAECSAGLLLGRPVELGAADDSAADPNLGVGMSPDRVPYSSVNGSFAASEAKRTLNSPLISGRSTPKCAHTMNHSHSHSHAVHHSEMMTLKRGYPQANAYHTVCTGNGNGNGSSNGEMMCMHTLCKEDEYGNVLDESRLGSTLDMGCSCGTLNRAVGMHRCEVYLASPYRGAIQQSGTLNDALDGSNMPMPLALHTTGSVNTGYAHQTGNVATYAHSGVTVNGGLQTNANTNTLYCAQLGSVEAFYGVNATHHSAVDIQKAVALSYNNNLASGELDDKSPTLSNSTNSTATFVNKANRADMENV